MLLNYIPDGQNRKAFVKGIENLFDDLRFVYRPMLAEDCAILNGKIIEVGGQNSEPGMELIRLEMVDRIISWDLLDDKKKPLKVDENSVRRLQSELFYRVYLIIKGQEAGNVDPQARKEEILEEVRTRVAAKTSGQTVGQVREEAQEKNSNSGSVSS